MTAPEVIITEADLLHCSLESSKTFIVFKEGLLSKL